MPYIKIGDLTTFTGDTSGSWIVMNDETNATTYKVQKETYFTSSLYGTASYALTASYVANASSFPYTGSAAISGSLNVIGPVQVTGNLTASNALFTGNITAQTLVVQTITSSVEYVTGSTKFGTLSTDTHQFTGSVSVTGSLTLASGVASLTASNALTASYVAASSVVGLNLSQISSGSVSASVNVNSASFQITSGSSTFLFVSNSGVTVLNSTSQITASPYTLQVIGQSGGTALFSNSAKTQAVNINLGTAGETRIYGDYFGAGADQKLILGTFAGRASQLVLHTSQNVSIGTATDPIYKLNVNGTGNYEGDLRLGVGFQFIFNNNNVGLYRDSNTLRLGGFGGIEFLASATNISAQTIRMKIFDTGNLSVGSTTDSGFKLDVSGSTRITNNLTVSGSLTASGSSHTISGPVSITNGGTTLSATSTQYFHVVNTGDSVTQVGGLQLNNATQNYSAYIYTGRSGTANAISFDHQTLNAGANAGNQAAQRFSSNATVFGAANSTTYNHTLTIYNRGGGTITYPIIIANQINSTNSGVGYLFNTRAGDDATNINHGAIQAVKTNLATSTVTSNMRFLTISDTANTLAEKMRISDSGNILIGDSTDSGHKLLVSGSGPSGSLNVDNTLYVSGSNVGIGTSSPSAYKLDVSGTARVQGQTLISNGNNIVLQTTSAVETNHGINWQTTGGSIRGFVRINWNSGEFKIGGGGGGYFPTFYSQDTERARITSTGNVLINTTTDSGYKLDVSGSFRSFGNITATSGSSYFSVSHSLTQPAQTGSQISEVYIAPTFTYTAPNQTQTALRVLATYTGSSALSSSQANIIADIGATSVGSQFIVNDVTSGSIYLVNDVSGLPIIEANSNWDVFMYDYPNTVFKKTGSVVELGIQNNTSSYTQFKSDLVINEGLGFTYRQAQASGSTNGAVTASLYSITFTTVSSSVYMHAVVTGYDTGSREVITGDVKATVKYAAGAASVVGYNQSFLNSDNSVVSVDVIAGGTSGSLVAYGTGSRVYQWGATVTTQVI
jgi:hypothetical protein